MRFVKGLSGSTRMMQKKQRGENGLSRKDMSDSLTSLSSILVACYMIIIIWVVVSNIFFSPLFGEDSHFDKYFSNGLKPPTSYYNIYCQLNSSYY